MLLLSSGRPMITNVSIWHGVGIAHAVSNNGEQVKVLHRMMKHGLNGVMVIYIRNGQIRSYTERC